MPRVRDLLYRLRPSGAPGAANPPGVPADRAREAADELALVFALLEPVEAECHRIVATARNDAEVQRAHDREVARDLVASAQARIPVEREAARARARQSADERTAAAQGRGQASAERVHRRSAEQLPHYVDLVVDRVWELVGQPTAAPGDQPTAAPEDQPTAAPGDQPAAAAVDRPAAALPRDTGVGP
jgi:hypothetical protein